MGVRRKIRTGLTGLIAVLALTAAATGAPVGPARSSAADDVPDATVEGPVHGGIHDRPWFSSLVDLAPHGFIEQEFFVSGTTSEDDAYKTRLVVRRPIDPGDFSGTVFVEWVNVTGGRDLETLWPAGHRTLLEEGHAYVVVSAQLVGHSELRAWDPVRYGTLTHPGDTPGSFEIFEQAVKAVRFPTGVAPLGPLDPDYVIATGDSQSAGRLTTYITDGYAIDGLIDGFLPGRGGGNEGTGEVAAELGVPMLWILEESQAERPEDTEWQKFWFQAGAAHAPMDWNHYVWRSDMRDLGANAPVPDAVNSGCSVNRGEGYAVRGGIHWINRWVRGVDPENAHGGHDATDYVPPTGPRLERDEAGDPVRDEDGHAIGGIRYPYIEVPIGVNSATVCPLFGNYEPFSSAEILDRYPTRDDYLTRLEAAADAAVEQGFMVPSDKAVLMSRAAAFDVWSPGAATCYDVRTVLERVHYDATVNPCPTP